MAGRSSNTTHGTLATYSAGFVLSVLLTIEAYLAVTRRLMGGKLVPFIVSLAVAQLLVQLIFFLHLGRETKPRWNLVMFAFMLTVVGIIVVGSLWIMSNLDYNMSGHDVDTYIIKDEGIKP